MPSAASLIHNNSNIIQVDAADPVIKAVELMAAQNFGSVVVKSDGQFVGIFTERDVLNRVVAKRLDTERTTVKQVMSAPVVCCQKETTISECKSIMTKKKLRHLPVVDGSELLGMVSAGDILAYEANEQEHTIKYLHEYLYEMKR
jgi:CBS domain-containing protein